MAPILRLELDYGPSHAKVVSSTLVEGEAPPADPRPDDDSDGVWLSVDEAEGTAAFYRVLPQPDRPVEIFAEDGTIAAAEGWTGPSTVSIDLPWIGADGAVTVRSGRGGLGMAIDGRAPAILRLSLGEAREAGLGPADLTMGGDEPPVTTLAFGQDHPKAIRLIFLPDGFTAAELPTFHTVVEDFLRTFGDTPPIDGLRDAFSACRVEVASPSSGVRDPMASGNGAQPPFGSKLGSGSMRRLIEVDQLRARKAVKRAAGGHAFFAGIVVANTIEYGGSGGDVAVFSRHALAAQIAIHELGHSRFNLADEYSSAGQSSTDKPIEANVAAKPNPQSPVWAPGEGQSLKWGAMLSAGVALPTSEATAQPETVGAFEGAKYKTSGIFRPSAVCKMRVLTDSFCPVCRDQIRAKLQPHLP